MTRKFTTPCFIRKNTPELRKKLEELGYAVMYGYDAGFTITNPEFGVAFLPVGPKVKVYENSNEEYIDCGTNEDLFLALAALREDTDRNQLFVYDTTDCIDESMRTYDFFVCDEDKIEDMMFYDCEYLNCHKATVEELIEHFKN